MSDEELERLDEEAARKEVEKLKGMGVIAEITRNESPQGAKWLTLKNVYDWRFRSPGNGEPERWLRRCRIVCREFRTTTGSSAETFAPTSGLAAIKLVVVLHCVLRLLLWTLDCADAFLQVPQQEPCIVEILVWVKKLLGYTQEMIWHLTRCLPGQRNAGLRWFEYLKAILLDMGFVACSARPTILRHVKRQAFINVHVDDELLAANKKDGEWVITILSQKLTLKINGPYPEIEDKEMLYLKRIFKFVEEGVLVLPNGKYFEALEKLTGLSSTARSFKPKPTPDHTGVGKSDSSKELTGEESSKYRSILGVLLYLCQERPDVQYAVKNLASYLKTPIEAATTFAKRTVKYLLGTKDYGILYPYGSLMSNTMDRINSQETKETSKVPTVEVSTDSDWGGSAKDRSSTSSGMVFVCSCLVSSWSRTQKSIALSSCEAELVAATIGAAEGILLFSTMKIKLYVCLLIPQKFNRILIREVLKFVLNKEVHLDVRMDSSSAKQWLQRSGIGRLKHLAARSLWLQNAVKEKELFLKAIPTQFNLGDLNTKRLTRARREMLMYYLPLVDCGQEPLEKVGEGEVYKAVCKRVCQGDQAVVTMTRLVQAVMLLEGVGVRGEGDMDRQVGPLRRAGMDYFGYNDADEFIKVVRDVCLVLMGVFFGAVAWLMWDKLTGPKEPEEEPHAEPQGQQQGVPEPQQRLVEPPEVQQQVEPGEAQQQVEPGEAQQQVEPACEPNPRVRLQPGQQDDGEFGTPEEIQARLHAWMREEIVRDLRREEEAARQQREREYKEELQRNRDQILADLRVQANQFEYQRTSNPRRGLLPPGTLSPTQASPGQSGTSHVQGRGSDSRIPRVRSMSRLS